MSYRAFSQMQAATLDTLSAEAAMHTKRLRIEANGRGAAMAAALFLALMARARFHDLPWPDAFMQALETLLVPAIPLVIVSAVVSRMYFRSRKVHIHPDAPRTHHVIFYVTELIIGMFLLCAAVGMAGEVYFAFAS